MIYTPFPTFWKSIGKFWNLEGAKFLSRFGLKFFPPNQNPPKFFSEGQVFHVEMKIFIFHSGVFLPNQLNFWSTFWVLEILIWKICKKYFHCIPENPSVAFRIHSLLHEVQNQLEMYTRFHPKPIRVCNVQCPQKLARIYLCQRFPRLYSKLH